MDRGRQVFEHVGYTRCLRRGMLFKVSRGRSMRDAEYIFAFFTRTLSIRSARSGQRSVCMLHAVRLVSFR